jgi:hypothetical protein
MKRTGNLWPLICSEEALAAAWRRASQHKRAHRACFEFSRNAGAQIASLQRELEAGARRAADDLQLELYTRGPTQEGRVEVQLQLIDRVLAQVCFPRVPRMA